MYAIVEIAGQQFKVEKGQEIFVHRLGGKEGDKIEFENVLLIDNNGKLTIGMPTIAQSSIKAEILSHDKGDKVIVFKKKRRKGYKVKKGHRQLFTKLKITNIAAPGIAKSVDAKTTSETKKAVTATTKKTTTKKATTKKATTKKATTKKTTTKKTTAKKTTAKKSTTIKNKK